MRSRVDFPQPDGPTKTTNSPRFDLQIDAFDDFDRAEGFSYAAQLDDAHPFTAPMVMPRMK